MPDYSKAKVYKLYCDDDDETYVGSTAVSLSQRFWGHKSFANRNHQSNVYRWMRDVGVNNVRIVLVENTPCTSFEEQRQHERRVCDQLHPSLNKMRPYITREEKKAADREYYQQNAETIKARAQKYAQDNVEKVFETRRLYREKNADALKEKKAAYYQDNIERERAKRRVYHEEHREERMQHSRQYYQENKDAILAKEKEQRRAAGAVSPIRYATDEDRKTAREAARDKYLEKNPELKRKWKTEWDAKNRDKIKADTKAYYDKMKQDPEWVQKNLERVRAYQARKKAQQAALED